MKLDKLNQPIQVGDYVLGMQRHKGAFQYGGSSSLDFMKVVKENKKTFTCEGVTVVNAEEYTVYSKFILPQNLVKVLNIDLVPQKVQNL